MKLIKEKLYEKYSEKSDPVEDMHIGISAKILEKVKKYCEDIMINSEEELEEFFQDYIEGETLDVYDMEPDIAEVYTGNKTMNNMAREILKIINEQI